MSGAVVASAFISYAHEDHEFMLVLVEQLQDQEFEIRYDQVVPMQAPLLARRNPQPPIVEAHLLIWHEMNPRFPAVLVS